MMLQDDILKSIELLKFSLNKQGIDSNSYLIALNDQNIPDKDMQLCLRLNDNLWTVYFIERGNKISNAVFDGYDDAIDYFYWQLIKPDTPWIYREEWEEATGEEF